MGDLFIVDFEKKEVLEFVPKIPYRAYSWRCDVCRTVYRYDTRKEDNTKYIVIEIPQAKVFICKECVKKANEMLGEMY